MNLLTVFKRNQSHRPARKHYFRPANIEAMRFSQSLLAKSIR
jgi:hypothetical protein